MPKETPLAIRIQTALADARKAQTPDGKSPRKWVALGNGLEIHVQFTSHNVFRLGLARPDIQPMGEMLANKYPSRQEWETVINHWPEENTSVTKNPEYKSTYNPLYFWLVGEMTIASQPQLL